MTDVTRTKEKCACEARTCQMDDLPEFISCKRTQVAAEERYDNSTKTRWVRAELYEQAARERDQYKLQAEINMETIKAMCAENSRGL